MSRKPITAPFHSAFICGIELHAVLGEHGPSLTTNGLEAPIPLVRGAGLADVDGRWSIVSRDTGAVLLGLERCGGREIAELFQEFGLTRVHDGSARPDAAFHDSRAWTGLTRWVSRNTGQANTRKGDDACMPGWHRQVMVALDARSNPDNFDPVQGGMRLR